MAECTNEWINGWMYKIHDCTNIMNTEREYNTIQSNQYTGINDIPWTGTRRNRNQWNGI